MIIVTQDRDSYVKYKTSNELFIEVVTHDGIRFGYNVLCDGILLGTFDYRDEAIFETRKIQDCYRSNETVYCVRI